MLKLILLATTWNAIFLFPAFSMDPPPQDKKRIKKANPYQPIINTEPTEGERFFELAKYHIYEYESQKEIYKKYKKDKMKQRIQDWLTPFESSQPPKFQKVDKPAKVKEAENLIKAIPFLEDAINLGVPEAKLYLAVVYFRLSETDPKTYNDLAIETLKNVASEKNINKKDREKAAQILSALNYF